MTRKRANQSKENLPTQPIELAPNQPKIDLIPLNARDGEILQDMVNLNNVYSSLLKQQQQYDAMLFMLKIRREQVVKGEVKLPMMIKITNTLSYAESDKNKVLKNVDDEIKNVQLARDGLQGTIEYRRDAFRESLIKAKNLLQEKTKDFEIKKITGVFTQSKETQEAEKKALEKEFDELLKKDTKEKK
jgi:hypothetical protein